MTVHIPSAAANEQVIRVHNPLTGAEIGRLPLLDSAAVAAVAERARAAQPEWEARGVKARAKLIRDWLDAVWDDRTRLIEIIRRETGKTDSSALVEIMVMDNIGSYYAKHAARFLRPQRRAALVPLIQRGRLVYHAYGVAGFITPWNYPYLNALCDLIPALIAGNAVVVKPSETAPYAALYGVEKLIEVGVPPDVVGVVTGDGTTGSALIDHADVISVTGSTATGRKVAARAAERLIPCWLELGGKDPLIVLEDADLDAAAAGTLRAALENAGQACISVERVYVVEAVYDQFLAKLATYAAQVTLGSDAAMGSLTHERELLRTEAHLRDATAKGARVLCGGKRRPELGALFFEPTILVDVDHRMAVMREETFGPLVPVMRVRDAEAAIRLANESDYGLSASIYTRDLKRGEALAQRIEAGDVAINRPQIVFGTPDLPMGGVKQSGIGRRGGREGLLRFVRTQAILSDSLIGSPPSLTNTDSRTMAAFRVMRRLRRLLPLV